ncbi:HNH endonuclease (plasmid) [Entomospira nematocerorum]|uniref:HNH endonuclease n=1 Tax=Entomospira nematocerorum TaxID=2719987 RepID=A0A968GD88_9SPIO|nr:HNH endonuclease [Entomospira nematocera]NIZ47690.1 HNH endonuclease [Entomospira nematocera]WDI34665.1 HNH endonuclease [Entomospira nematocera]
MSYIFIIICISCQHQPLPNPPNTKEITLLPSVHQHLENQQHPITDIWYRRIITKRNTASEDVAIVAAPFPSIVSFILPEELWLASDSKQKRYLQRELKDAITRDSKLRRKFTRKQQQMIKDGKIPLGYTWHHDAPLGKMQLVDRIIHDATPHTGGRWIWGGGTNNRK